MKAISLWQPWASLIAVGAKRCETRSWPTRYRGPIAIHAARHWDRECSEALAYGKVQRALGGTPDAPILKNHLPFGAIVAVGLLADCVRTEDLPFDRIAREVDFGNFSAGRFAWGTKQIERLVHPAPCGGRQGLWDLKTYGNGGESFEKYLEALRSRGLIEKVGSV